MPLTAGAAVFPAERGAREAAFTDDDGVAPGVRMPLTSRGALFPTKRVGDRASQAEGFTDDDDVALVGVRVPLTARALGAVNVFPAEGDGDVARREVAAFTDNEGGRDANVSRRCLTGGAAGSVGPRAATVLLTVVVSSLTLAALGAEVGCGLCGGALRRWTVRRKQWQSSAIARGGAGGGGGGTASGRGAGDGCWSICFIK